LLLGAAATLLVVLATPPGWATRLPLALGFVGAVVLLRCRAARVTTWSPRPGPATPCSPWPLVVLCLAIMTLPRPGAKKSPAFEETTTSE